MGAGPDGRLDVLRATRDMSDGETQELFVATFAPSQPGLYRVNASVTQGGKQVGSATAAVLVGAADACRACAAAGLAPDRLLLRP